ncbi:MAG: 2-amino-4-hydroxy-6-hydroxymethyldihydropteridine diphosphokinase [Bacteroidales bacterium]|nr:2-amino-4-hydroxy-6-hydroxymethyldihydropteridine diphosphokinase [Bacteroidales bacterium]MDD4821755.1 2-amino-4-hydroxy-6-hydroxymethyldihydropteridine diphosphokinase [Bacteroidales bacterium]
MNHCLLSLGSNDAPEASLEQARELLKQRFQSLRWGAAKKTEPIGMPPGTPWFINQVGFLYTSLSSKEIRSVLKEMEELIGQTPETKEIGCIRMDIDLLCFNGKVLKEKEYNYPCIRSLIKELLEDDIVSGRP